MLHEKPSLQLASVLGLKRAKNEEKKEQASENGNKPVTIRALKACLNTAYLEELKRKSAGIIVHRDRNAAKNILHLGLGGYFADRIDRPLAFSRTYQNADGNGRRARSLFK